eukprot:4402592-Prymnesium_polylepis.2
MKALPARCLRRVVPVVSECSLRLRASPSRPSAGSPRVSRPFPPPPPGARSARRHPLATQRCPHPSPRSHASQPPQTSTGTNRICATAALTLAN